MEGRIVACAGCSRRRTPFGGNGSPLKDDSLFDPVRDGARWGLFVHPAFARRGLGSLLLRTCESAARDSGFAASS